MNESAGNHSKEQGRSLLGTVLSMDRRRTLWLLAAGSLGLLLLLLAGSLDRIGQRDVSSPSTDPPPVAVPDSPAAGNATPISALEATLSHELERMLGQVDGAGRVAAWVTVASGAEQIYARDVEDDRRVTEESDVQGGRRLVEEASSRSQVVFGDRDSPPLVRQVRAADVRGVLVVAEGGRDSVVRWRLLRAVQVALGVPAHRVQIISGKDGG